MNKSEFNQTKSIVILVMAFLLLIAPCSFKNNLEAALNITKTKPLNPSKSLNNGPNYCSDWENNAKKTQLKLTNSQIKKMFTITIIDRFITYDHTKYKADLHVIESNTWTTPYYILYKRLKIFDPNKIKFA